MRQNRKAISPVIATIIIVAVAIVMSIAVAYWLLGLGATFTRYEKLEFVVAYPEKITGGWDIKLRIKNTGSSDATINIILLNGKLNKYANVTCNDETKPLNVTDLGILVGAGKLIDLVIHILEGNYTSGQTLEIMVQTAAGYQYPKSVTLT